MRKNKGSILVGVLWCLALLSVVVIGVLHTSRLDLIVVKNYADKVQAHYIALAAVEKTKALIYLDSKNRSQSGKSYSAELRNSQENFRNVAFGRGHFQVLRRGREDEGGGIIYGIDDEESRLNVNTAPSDQLQKIQGMTPDVLAAIVDWRDGDNVVSPGGAEQEYYEALQPPSLPRNGPFQTIREMLMVRGITKDLLMGSDTAQNGQIDEDQKESGPGAGLGRAQGGASGTPAWATILTIASSVKNLTSAGQAKVNVQTGNEQALTGVRGITSPMARAMIAYRGQNEFKSIIDLLDVTAQNQNQNAGGRGAANNNNNSGSTLIDQNLLQEIGDEIAVTSDDESAGLVNVNSAGIDVLACLPGVTRDLAQAIISYRQSSGSIQNIAYLLKVSGMTKDILKQLAPFVTVRSDTYRIIAEGKVDSSGVKQRIETIVRVGLHEVTTLSYREDL
ncbi:MAG: comEA protein [Verrucomicrobiales bacterium]|nr:comEA protein [Verrucomicrobiales bacterium]